MFVLQVEDREDVLAFMVGAGGPLDPAAPISFAPYHTPIAQSTRLVRATVIAEVATFAGSAAITPPVWGPQYRDGSDNRFVDSQLLEWVCTADQAPETIYGVILDDGALVRLEVFPTPVTIQLAGDAVRVVITVPFGQ